MDIKYQIDYSYEIIKNIDNRKNNRTLLVICDLNKTGEKKYYSLKKLEINDKNKFQSINLVRKIKSMNRKYIIKINDFFIEKEDTKEYLCLLTDYYEKGNLEELINKKESISLRFIWKIFIQLVFGLNSLHSNNIIAQNLTPQNIYIDNENNALISGLYLDSGNIKDKEYSLLLYNSPEIINGKGYNQKSDVWSLGCILYELITGKKPFYLIENILKIKYDKNVVVNNDFLYLLSKLLSYENSRISINLLLKDRMLGIKIIEENLFNEENIKGK